MFLGGCSRTRHLAVLLLLAAAFRRDAQQFGMVAVALLCQTMLQRLMLSRTPASSALDVPVDWGDAENRVSFGRSQLVLSTTCVDRQILDQDGVL